MWSGGHDSGVASFPIHFFGSKASRWPGICRQTDHGWLTPTSTSSDSSMMTMPGPRGPTADEQACGASRAHRCKETRRRYSATAKNATQAIRAAPATEATMGHQRKPAAAAPPPPDDVVVVGEDREAGTAALRLLAREAAACEKNATPGCKDLIVAYRMYDRERS